MDPRSKDENAQDGQCAMEPGTEDSCAAEGVMMPDGECATGSGIEDISAVEGAKTPSLLPAPKRPLIGRGGLPTFKFGGYAHTVGSGLRKEAERKGEERRREEKKWKKYREERERKTAMFVTPGLPPLAMAPDFDPVYLESRLCSDLQARRLFPNDPAKQCAIKDLQGEDVAVGEFWIWLTEQKDATDDKSSGELARCGFYEELYYEVHTDYNELEEEYITLMASATVLGKFEFYNLDKDGRTTALEALLSEGKVIDDENDPTVQAAYQTLWTKYPYLERFENCWGLDEGTGELEENLRYSKHLFDNKPEEVKRKYGYLLDRLKAEGTWSHGGYGHWKKTEHESHGTENPASSGFSPTTSSRDEDESITEEKGTEATEKPTKRRLTI